MIFKVQSNIKAQFKVQGYRLVFYYVNYVKKILVNCEYLWAIQFEIRTASVAHFSAWHWILYTLVLLKKIDVHCFFQFQYSRILSCKLQQILIVVIFASSMVMIQANNIDSLDIVKDNQSAFLSVVSF